MFWNKVKIESLFEMMKHREFKASYLLMAKKNFERLLCLSQWIEKRKRHENDRKEKALKVFFFL